VSIKRGTNILIPRKEVRAEYDWMFSQLLTVVSSFMLDASGTRVTVSKNEQFIDPVHELPLDSPIQLCQQYGNNICHYLAPLDIIESSSDSSKQCGIAFEVLMSSSKERKWPRKADTSGTHNVNTSILYV